MRTATRRLLRHTWRMMTWPLSGHLALALGTGLACAIAARYHDVMGPLCRDPRHLCRLPADAPDLVAPQDCGSYGY
jgi:hypothetical protein